MPLNPPSYRGQDVWFSPDVFINKVEVALWQPPQNRDAAELPSLTAFMEGDEVSMEDSGQARAQNQAYLQNMAQQGLISQDEIGRINSVRPNSADPQSGSPAVDRPPLSTDTEGVENLGSYPLDLQMSRHYTLRQLTMAPYTMRNYPIPDNGDPSRGLSKGRIVANLRLLARNILDPVRDRYSNSQPSNTWRPEPADPISANTGRPLPKQHPRGQAADIQFRGTPIGQYYDIAVWIRDTLAFDQMILEYNGRGSSWIHISWNPTGNRPNGPYKLATKVAGNWISTSSLVNMGNRT